MDFEVAKNNSGWSTLIGPHREIFAGETNERA